MDKSHPIYNECQLLSKGTKITVTCISYHKFTWVYSRSNRWRWELRL